MRNATSTLILILAGLTVSAGPNAAPTERADSNNAFYAGETFDYVLKAPAHFKMITGAARQDGYSFAFIPDSCAYQTANLVIGVNIYKVRGLAFANVLANDTSSIREHYGPDLVLRPLDSVRNGSGDLMTAFYLDNKKQFIANVMTAYYFGSTELLILELSIAPGTVRPEAEKAFIRCLELFTATKRGQLGAK
jgi:hypothetical protein